MALDTVFRNAFVIDGAGNPGFVADVGVKDGRIALVGPNTGRAAREIDAAGLALAPGFIDIHSHSDAAIHFDNRVQSTICQGITTCVVGNCGESMAPVVPGRVRQLLGVLAVFAPPGARMDSLPWNTFREYLLHVERTGCACNTAHLVGFGALRIGAGPGFEAREPSAEETARMRALAAEAMEAGAFGLSTGLIYTPQAYARTNEIVAVARAVAPYHGLYFSHIRGEGATVMRALEEMIDIVRRSGCRAGQVSHHKIADRSTWGLSRETLHLLEETNARGLDITCDQYPYTRGMTSLITLLPPWVHEGGIHKLLQRLENPELRRRIRHETAAGIADGENWIHRAGFASIYIASVKTERWKPAEGKSLEEITRLFQKQDPWETLFNLLLDEQGEVCMTIEMMAEEDIRRIMTGRYTMFGTDAAGVNPDGLLAFGKPHPRHYGTYPRILGRYVRQQRILTLESAVRKMTSFPAQRLGLRDRGMVREGMWADLVLFDPATVMDRATYEDPHRFPVGIRYVLVNGQFVVEEEKPTGRLPGRVLRRAAAPAAGQEQGTGTKGRVSIVVQSAT